MDRFKTQILRINNDLSLTTPYVERLGKSHSVERNCINHLQKSSAVRLCFRAALSGPLSLRELHTITLLSLNKLCFSAHQKKKKIQKNKTNLCFRLSVPNAVSPYIQMSKLTRGSQSICPSATEIHVWQPLPQKTNTRDVSFGWQGIWASYENLETWGDGRLFSKDLLRGFLLAQGLKGASSVKGMQWSLTFLDYVQTDDVSYRVLLVLPGCVRNSSSLVWGPEVEGGALCKKARVFSGGDRF